MAHADTDAAAIRRRIIHHKSAAVLDQQRSGATAAVEQVAIGGQSGAASVTVTSPLPPELASHKE